MNKHNLQQIFCHYLQKFAYINGEEHNVYPTVFRNGSVCKNNDPQAEAAIRPCIAPIQNMKAIQSAVVRAEKALEPYKKYLEQ